MRRRYGTNVLVISGRATGQSSSVCRRGNILLLRTMMFNSPIMIWVYAVAGILLSVVLSYTYLTYERMHLVTIEQADAHQPYDYIIVGAGTVGCVLASRLSESANNSVLLIEAGYRFNTLFAAVPLLALAMQGTARDWSYVSTVQQHSSHGLHGRRQFLPRGKGLGGSAQLNYMLHYNGANGADFDRWEQQAGASGWGQQTMHNYLQRLQQQPSEIVEPTAQKLQHQRVVSTPYDPDDELVRIFGAMRDEVHLTQPHLHFDVAEYNTKNGLRWNGYDTYLRPAMVRPNLHILYGTRVHRIQFDADRRATGVRVASDEQPITLGHTTMLRARHEIVLSAGAYGTPHLLKVSGIGPRAELERFRIPVVVDSPTVGQNLHEHLTVPLYVAINQSISLNADKLLAPSELWRYVRHGHGWWSRFGVVGFVGDWRQHHAIGLFGAGAMDEEVLRQVANTRSNVFRGQFPLYANSSQEGFVLLHTCHQPRSRGSVQLNGRSVRVPPLIDPQFLADRADVRCVRRAMRLAVGGLLRTQAMRAIGVRVMWPRLRECRNFGPWPEDWRTNEPSDRYLECLMRTIGVTAHHPGGTCAMGGQESESCVDERLRVRHINGLRVADASVMPTPVSGTPNTVLLAIGERAADLILSDNAHHTN